MFEVDGKKYPIYENSDDQSTCYMKDGKYYNTDGTEYTGDKTKLSPKQSTKGPTTFTGYNKLSADKQAIAKAAIDRLVEEGAMSEDVQADYANVYMDENGNIALKSDLRNLYGGSSGGTKQYFLFTLLQEIIL